MIFVSSKGFLTLFISFSPHQSHLFISLQEEMQDSGQLSLIPGSALAWAGDL